MRLLKPDGHCGRILAHLVRGRTLTTMSAMRLFGTVSLHSRLAELRRRGWKFSKHELKLKSGRRCLVYSLPKQR